MSNSRSSRRSRRNPASQPARRRQLVKRRFLLLSISSLAGLAASTYFFGIRDKYFKQASPSLPSSNRSFAVGGAQPLEQRAMRKGLFYGAAVTSRILQYDEKFSGAFTENCNILVPEWEMKWKNLRPSSSEFNFRQADQLVKFAEEHDMRVRGHTLVWHQDNPRWLTETIDPSNAEQLLIEHVETVAKRYAGKIHSWDVVNEAINLDHEQPNGLRNTIWFRNLGEEYIDIAFRAAAAADPNAMLTYNDFALDAAPKYQQEKREAVLKLLERLKNRGTPIHALGLQAHLKANEALDPEALKKFLRDVASMGLKIMVTELDVTDQTLPADITTRDRAVAALYEDYLSVILEEPAVIAVLTWGLSKHLNLEGIFCQL